jgi:hypothetical protein
LAGKAQWTWLIGTQWADMPAWRKAGFEPWDSDVGQLTLDRLDMTTSERQAHMQPPLFLELTPDPIASR